MDRPSSRPRGGQNSGHQGHARLDDSQKPCFGLKNKGHCRFGDRCRFSHGPASTQAARPSQTRSTTNSSNNASNAPPRDGKLQEWKRIILTQASNSRSHHPAAGRATQISRLFQLGLELMDGDPGAAQDAIKLLVTDAGLSFIRDMAERHISQTIGSDPAKMVVLWTTQVRPLFQLVTHPRIVDSAVLEQEMAAIFNFMLGVGGSRMVRIFSFVTALAASPPSAAAVSPDESRMSVVELSLAVLSKILDCNTANMVNEHFGKIAADLAKFVHLPVQSDEEFSKLQATKYLEYIKCRLEVGDNIPAFQSAAAAQVARETFVLRRDLPGRLSAQGRRHDNDHANITSISIMPTYEEIMSPRAEYLPTTDPSQWHLKGIRGRLDREFRLLREDTVGQLRDAVRDMLHSIRAPPAEQQHRQQSRNHQNSARTYTYNHAIVHDVKFDKRKGLEVMVRCTQPAAVQKLGVKQRRQWWEATKRLQAGALVCMLDATGSLLFFVVGDATLRTVNDKHPIDAMSPRPVLPQSVIPQEEISEKLTLSEDKDSVYVLLEFVDAGRHEVTQLLRWSKEVRSSPTRHLVEFPGVLLASFKHTLEGLQQMHAKPKLPFADLIAPSTRNSAEAEVPPPLYASARGFEFDLRCLALEGEELLMRAHNPPDAGNISARTGLDPTQSRALLHTLSRQVSLIQGPPGTGKSFTGEKIVKVLLANKTKARLGPILCVCYTNHALDQLLEHLLDQGSPRILRMGSRSKSERLQGLNLRVLTSTADRTKSEKRDLWQLNNDIDELEGEASATLRDLAHCDSTAAIQKFLVVEYPRHHQELFGKMGNDANGDSWQVVDHHRGRAIDKWLRGGDATAKTLARQPNVLASISSASMTRVERAALHRSWVKAIRDAAIAKLAQMHTAYANKKGQRDRIRREVDLRCLQQADVVGVTTSGLARNLDLLRKLSCKVMLCEEAGEVLEAHTLTTLLPSVEHAILIGDHLQLRPQIQNYELQSTNPRGAQYSLDISLFERLVQPPYDEDIRLPVSALETQRRMHPSIAQMVRSTLYPALKDADNVKLYPSVTGIRQRLFWFHHEHLEDGAMSSDPLNTSHSNDFETKMTAALVSHLVRQGDYTQGDIAVLTPYLGQLQKLRKQMEGMVEISVGERDLEELEALTEPATSVASEKQHKKQPQHGQGPTKTTLLKSVRLATVDNFQGEEARVVIISLVRSNPQQKCGFLSTTNRINVLLSRAQHGCYIIGNAATYGGVPMWAQVIAQLRAAGNLDASLPLQCPRHPETPITVSAPDHFGQFAPDGGCRLACDKRLGCGHACHGRCHADVMHSAYKCLEKCPRAKKGCDHACPRVCGDACEAKCRVKITGRVELPCGHSVSSAECWQAQDPSVIRCLVPVSRTIPGCSHIVKAACYIDVAAPNYVCRAECGHNRDCGHACRSPCYRCNNRRKEGDNVVVVPEKANHGICQQVCGRPFTTCQHTCPQVCHGESKCKPCRAPCEVRCSHSRCSKACHEPCAPCAEGNCASRCEHTKCTMPCAAPCDWVPCSKRCESKLPCGHQCPSLCGETCPSPAYCQVCGTEATKTAIVDYIEMQEYREIDLNVDPCIFPDCGHFLTVSSLDGSMSMGAQYKLDPMTGHPVAIASSASAAPFSMEEIKTCPTCRGSLRSIARYGRIVRRAMLDEATKKFIAWSSTRHDALAERLLAEQAKLEGTKASIQIARTIGREGKLDLTGGRQAQLFSLQHWVGDQRYTDILKLWHEIKRYIGKVRAEEQPFQRVVDLVRHASRNRTGGSEFVFDEGVVQLRGYLMAASLLLRCDLVILSDFLELRKGAAQTRAEISADFGESLAECERLVMFGEETHRPQVQAEGHVYYARFCVFARALDTAQGSQNAAPAGAQSTPSPEEGTEHRERHKQQGLAHIAQARALLLNAPSSVMISESELAAVEKMLNDGVFYRTVTSEEMRAVYQAMQAGFSGTGHWYTCLNRHPFTVGECGMPMEQARCPECGAPVGGAHHQAAEGVRHATEIEELARGLAGVQI